MQEETAFRGFVNKVKQLGNKLEGRFGERTLDIVSQLDVCPFQLRLMLTFFLFLQNCSYMNCLKISCTVGPLKAGETAEIVIESRLWINTLFDESYYDATISSVAMAQILEVPYKVAGFSHPGQSAVVSR